MKPTCRESDGMLSRYADSELGRGERRRLEAHLSECEACRTRLALLRHSAALLREHFEHAADSVDFAAFEDRVLAGIRAAPPVPWSERLRVWLREALYQHRAVWVSSLATAAVLVALLVPWSDSWLDPRPAPEPSGGMHTAQVEGADNEAIIDRLEYGGQKSMIFNVSKNNTTVIWLVDFDQAGDTAQGDEI